MGSKFTLKRVLDSNLFCVNFLFKKELWVSAGGYPEDIGWDTQGFTLRFLACNKHVAIVPDSKYFHRKHVDSSSYYHREELDGKGWINSWLILEDILPSLSNDQILNFISDGSIEKDNNISLASDIKEEFSKEFKEMVNLSDQGNLDRFFELLTKCMKTYPKSRLLHYFFYRRMSNCLDRVQCYKDLAVIFSEDFKTDKGFMAEKRIILRIKYFIKSILRYLIRR
jgi:hypothetical protein